jgi:hypothetical protein
MRQLFALFALVLVAALAQPASAITFPSLTTIYIGGGVHDSGGEDFTGRATTFVCTNVSGRLSNIRFLVLQADGTVAKSVAGSIAHGQTHTISTKDTGTFHETNFTKTGFLSHGAINIEATESAVFCHASVLDATFTPSFSMHLPLVRINPHPGSVE